jgi:BirA family transcriptional regulator, biotin operon repressor / biotin---[acetyl-CoA-carboxylase] ligase
MNSPMKIPAGKNIYYYQEVDSTNMTARQLADRGGPAFSIVLAEEQLKGRGRQGKNWHSPPGSGLWFSVLLRPEKISPSGAAPVTLVTGAVIARRLREACGIPVMVKWPNDLLAGSGKIGGILTELKGGPEEIEYLVIGIGLNINQQENDFPAELKDSATSIYLESGKRFDRQELFLSLREDLIKAYRLFFTDGFDPFHRLWKENSATLGREVSLVRNTETIQGKALDLTPDGALLVQDREGKVHKIWSGEIN